MESIEFIRESKGNCREVFGGNATLHSSSVNSDPPSLANSIPYSIGGPNGGQFNGLNSLLGLQPHSKQSTLVKNRI